MRNNVENQVEIGISDNSNVLKIFKVNFKSQQSFIDFISNVNCKIWKHCLKSKSNWFFLL